MASPSEIQPKDSDINPTRLNSGPATRLGSAIEIFQGLTKDPDGFKLILDRFGYFPSQARFVAEAANLVNTGSAKYTDIGTGVRYSPNPGKDSPEGKREKIAEGIYTSIDTPGPGAASLIVHAPKDKRIIDGGYVKWGILSRDEGADLRRLAEKSGDFLRLVIVDPSMLDERNFRKFIMASHPDDPNLQPQNLFSGVFVRFAGKTEFKRAQGSGLFDAAFQSKGGNWNETWVAGSPPVQEAEQGKVEEREVNQEKTEPEGVKQEHVLVGKRVNS